MTEYVLYTVYWDDMNDSTYLYGSSVQYLNKRYVSFESLMMPAGVPIKEWDSFTDFQAARHEPRLPLLRPGERYVFRVFCRDEPRGTVFFRPPEQADFLLHSETAAGKFCLPAPHLPLRHSDGQRRRSKGAFRLF